jgi:hypothetical protein
MPRTGVNVGQGIAIDKGVEIFGGLQAGETLLVNAGDERKPGTHAFRKVQRQVTGQSVVNCRTDADHNFHHAIKVVCR